MSLVDYASSDEEDEAVGREEARNNDNPVIIHANPPHEKAHPPNDKSTKLPVQQSTNSTKYSEPSTFKLPDASFLLESPSLPSNMSGNYDHNSRVAAAMAQNASRKRDSKESTASNTRGKIPRGKLPHSKNIPETERGLLRPPQLSGSASSDDEDEGIFIFLHRQQIESMSNVVTEDINKLFTRRNSSSSEPSSSRPETE